MVCGPSRGTGWAWTRVVLNRGIDQHLGPVSLSRIERRTDIAATALPDIYRVRLAGGVEFDNRADADALLRSLAGAGAGLRMVQGPTPDLQIGHRRLDPADPRAPRRPLTQRLGIPGPSPSASPTTSPTTAPIPST